MESENQEQRPVAVHSSEEEGFEIDLTATALNIHRVSPFDYYVSTDRSSNLNDEVSVDDVFCPESESSRKAASDSIDSSFVEQTRRVDEDISLYWKRRGERQMKMISTRQERRKLPVLPSYSAEGRFETESKSLLSASVETRTTLGSNSRSIDTDDDNWRRNRGAAMTSHRQKTKSGSAFKSPAPNKINAVRASSSLLEDGVKMRSSGNSQFPQAWKMSYVERTKNHHGYFDIDVHSLYSSCPAFKRGHPLDSKPWEFRIVKQRFLHEQSLSFCRNWLGCITEVNGNEKLVQKICQVKCMEMPMKAEEWKKDWYKKRWAGPVPSNLSGSLVLESPSGQENEFPAPVPYSNPFLQVDRADSDDDDLSWEETPECGKFKHVILKPGDRISRVSPDLTSYLRRSRWRKKHFPRGTCPYK